MAWLYNKLMQRKNGRYLAGVIFELIFLYENCCIFIHISQKFVAKGSSNNLHRMLWFVIEQVAGQYRNNDGLV